MTIHIDRSQCRNLQEIITREWLVTNGRGGYAAGTVAGVLTRKEHGLLVAVPAQAQKPYLLVAKIDEEVVFNEKTYYLGVNEYRDGTIHPAGFVHLEEFYLEDGFPVFVYRLGSIEGIQLEKRIWMVHGENTTYIQYRAVLNKTPESTRYKKDEGNGKLHMVEQHRQNPQNNYRSSALILNLLPFTSYRPYNQLQFRGQNAQYREHVHATGIDTSKVPTPLLPDLCPNIVGCTIQAHDEAEPYHVLAIGQTNSNVTFIPTDVWYWNFLHRQDKQAAEKIGREAIDDLYLPGVIRATFWPGEEMSLTLMVSSEHITTLFTPEKQSKAAYQLNLAQRQTARTEQRNQNPDYSDLLIHQRGRDEQDPNLHFLSLITEDGEDDPAMQDLLQATEHFLIEDPEEEQGYSLLTNFFQQERNTRETLIALPGLLLIPGNYQAAASLLRKQVHQKSQCVDTVLWYFYTLDYYLAATQDLELLEELFPVLKDYIKGYIQGYIQESGQIIQMDEQDYLLHADASGEPVTWMNAIHQGKAITPRNGKAVEVNALWYHALSLMCEWAQHMGLCNEQEDDPGYYQQLRERCQYHFQQRFWYEQGGYLYDVIDGPEGEDTRLRPNQLLACSLRYPVADQRQQQQIFNICTRHLLTAYGLRSLAECDREKQADQSLSPHQGGIWPWLLGPYIDTMVTIEVRKQLEIERQGLYKGEKEQRQYQNIEQRGMKLLKPMFERLQKDLLGMCEEVYEGESPHQPYHTGASAASISMGELLRSYRLLKNIHLYQPGYILSR